MTRHDNNTIRTDGDHERAEEATGHHRSELGGGETRIGDGDRAPDFRLPGTRGPDARLFHLDEYVRRGGILLVFSGTESVRDSVDGVTGVAPWFQFDGIRVWFVTDAPYPRGAIPATDSVPGATVLTDIDGSVTERYGVRYGTEVPSVESGPVVVLVDQSRTIRFVRQVDDPYEPEPIGELRRTIEHVQTPKETPV